MNDDRAHFREFTRLVTHAEGGLSVKARYPVVFLSVPAFPGGLGIVLQVPQWCVEEMVAG